MRSKHKIMRSKHKRMGSKHKRENSKFKLRKKKSTRNEGEPGAAGQKQKHMVTGKKCGYSK